jgi:diguanylate cyclase (GGDEF)-like protein
MIDVDFFFFFNDTYGHSAGDDCLSVIAKVIKKSLSRADDFVARYGGEEFCVVLPDTDEIGARTLAGKILENVRSKNITHKKNKVANCVTLSKGETTCTLVNNSQKVEDNITICFCVLGLHLSQL